TVVAPKPRINQEGGKYESLVENGKKAKLELELSYKAYANVTLTLRCAKFPGGSKTVQIAKGQKKLTHEFDIDDGWAKTQDVTLDAAPWGKDKMRIQRYPKASFAQSWISPVKEKYAAGDEVTVTAELSGPAPLDNIKVKLTSDLIDAASPPE